MIRFQSDLMGEEEKKTMKKKKGHVKCSWLQYALALDWQGFKLPSEVDDDNEVLR